MKVRIGIDVGGTFTDAVAIDNETFEVVGSVKVPTTHTAAEGVAAGIVQVLHKVMDFNTRAGFQMCVGCGRCDAICPEYISLTNCINTKLPQGMKEVLENGQ